MTVPAGDDATDGQLDALRRVAELIARGAGRTAVLDAVVAEAYSLFPVEFTAILRYEPGGAASIVAVHHGPPGLLVGERAPYIPQGLVLRVFGSGRPARVEAYGDLPDRGLARMRELGISAGAAAPIRVDGRLWGVLTAMTQSGPVVPGLEHRLVEFAEVAAVAIASAQARAGLRLIAPEQAALRRVAEAMAHGGAEQQLFDTVTEEVSALLGAEGATLVRFSGRRASVIATVGPAVEIAEDAVAAILRTRLPVRLDTSGGPGSEQAGAGDGSSVAVPIMVKDRLWGMLGVSTTGHQLPADTERRLGQFTELVATAVATSEAWARAEQLAGHQSALRRIAELAARDAPGEQVLEAITVQAAKLTGVQFTAILRFEPDGSREIMALSGAPAGLRPGMRTPANDGATGRVWRTNRTARVEGLDDVGGPWAQIARDAGFSAGTAVPIRMHSRLWGTLVAVGRTEPLPASVEDDLTSFAELAGTAISATQARNDLRALADEQAALRRVAELVAIGTALDDVFQAVAGEAAKLLGSDHARLQRYERDGTTVTVAAYDAGAETTLRADQQVTVPVVVEGRVWGDLTAGTTGRALPESMEERLRQFAGLAAAAIANAENKAHLTASRARVVATADETRRRLQRDVHDGAQQRLVHTIIALKLARAAIARGEMPGAEVSEALQHAERANAELRDLVHGILPAGLAQGGLRTGLESLIDDLSIPVDLRFTAPRLPAQTEITVYFFVAEALTNVVKHARASRAGVTVQVDGTLLAAEVRDDGIGGADPSGGSGLTGLSDRIQAADGTLALISPAGGGTTVRAVLPLPGTDVKSLPGYASAG
ncbi:GAF domain-containing protein [Actinoplanes friuliensis]|uniref:GAF domain-containing protein n=1 Tax=Actinoplanes friuliensis TaxID=196914 RepID=UPI000409E753|nr:GAF domain-containing protein [Actinoplanes friuliensis]